MVLATSKVLYTDSAATEATPLWAKPFYRVPRRVCGMAVSLNALEVTNN